MFKNKYIIGIVLAILTGFSSCADLDLAPLGRDRPRKKKHYTNGMHVFRLLHGEIV